MMGTIQCTSGLEDHPNQKRQLNENVNEVRKIKII